MKPSTLVAIIGLLLIAIGWAGCNLWRPSLPVQIFRLGATLNIPKYQHATKLFEEGHKEESLALWRDHSASFRRLKGIANAVGWMLHGTAEASPIWEACPTQEVEVDGVKGLLVLPEEGSAGASARRADILVDAHGGGFVLGDAAITLPMLCAVARRTGITILSVEYRLAPEHPFPAPLEDVARVAAAVAAGGAAAWGDAVPDGSPAPRVVIMGDSAGGHMAAAVALWAAGARPTACADGVAPAWTLGEPGALAGRLVGQVLIYPKTGEVNPAKYPSEGELSTFLPPLPIMKCFTAMYMQAAERPCAGAADFRAHPAAVVERALAGHADQLGRAPAPSLILVAEFDPLKDDGVAYGKLLSEHAAVAGVSAAQHRVALVEGSSHSFAAVPGFFPRGWAFAVDEITAFVERVVPVDADPSEAEAVAADAEHLRLDGQKQAAEEAEAERVAAEKKAAEEAEAERVVAEKEATEEAEAERIAAEKKATEAEL